MVLSLTVTIGAYSRIAEPVLSADMLPGDVVFAFGGVAAVIVFGAALLGIVSTRAWKAMGRQIGLTPEGGGIWGKPDLVAERNGRTVRTRTITQKVNKGGKGSSKVTHTVVEADLTEPADEGLMIGRVESNEDASMDLGGATVSATVLDDRFSVVGTGSEEVSRALLTNRARNALLDMDDFEYVSVGDPADALMEAVPDASGSFLGSAIESGVEGMLSQKTAGEVGTAAIMTKTVVFDADRIEHQIATVAALADAHEATLAEARAPESRLEPFLASASIG